ncbi:aminotransferase class IV [Acidiferrobacter thiooxydans]|jgi:D-alanine transaminase|uniref:Aminodeoxychorismate lyase n=1 Tax=Acidiferrobacter thiooxydans TaxID=163359 RepID=A0A368HJI4_9GAMM|nr:aminotransferase class IV [Acidiferrobacter thiooxydans]RCN58450.1 D-amino acid aminotransferase [Acidiferrobacter thiooxydans]UEO00053.1 aminotransferase class IV [Acidiferrobacter thiooxydans]
MLVYLNGDWIPADSARVSVFDRGFVFGDSVYEVIPVYGHRPFREAAHLARLKASMTAVGMDERLGPVHWPSVCARLAETLPTGDGTLYLQVTRGAAPRQHAFPANAPLTLFAYARPRVSEPAGNAACTAILCDDIRWARCDIKTTSLIANVLLVQEALSRGADEALLVRDDRVNEGAVSNVFAVCGEQLLTAPRNHLILGGITRDVVLELAAGLGIVVEERAPSRAELSDAREVFITGSSREVTAVTRIDGKPVGDGRPGPVFHRLHAAFQTFKEEVRMGRRM